MAKSFKETIFYLIIIGIFFFFAYSVPRFINPLVNFSPDENANYFFTKLFSEEKVLEKYEPLNYGIEPIIHPRSINVNAGNYLVPGSFLGIILIYGWIARILGGDVIIFLTPLFAFFAGLSFYGVIKKIFSSKIAFISSILMFSHPAWWYYSTRSMFHNVLFLSLLIIGIYFLLNIASSREKKVVFFKFKEVNLRLNYLNALLAGLFLGLSFIVRSVEVIWVGVILIILYFFYRKNIKVTEIFSILAIAFLFGISILFYNQVLYDNPFLTGYANIRKNVAVYNVLALPKNESILEDNSHINLKTQIPDNNTSALKKDDKEGFVTKIKRTILNNIPLNLKISFNWEISYNNFKIYFIDFFVLLSFLSFLGFAVFVVFLLAEFAILVYVRFNGYNLKEESADLGEDNKKKIILKFARSIEKDKIKHKTVYLLIFVLVSFYLVGYYGSWIFTDAPDPQIITIGSSYIRYWLPIYIMALPFISFLFVKIARLFKFRFPKIAFLISASVIVVLYNVRFVFYAPYEGIKKILDNTNMYDYKRQRVMELSENDSVIVSQYYDKILFPERKVITSKLYNDEEVIKNISLLTQRVPVYYYSLDLKEKDIDYMNKRYLSNYKLKLINGQTIVKDEVLWKIEKK